MFAIWDGAHFFSLHGLVVKGGAIWLVVLESRCRSRPTRASAEDNNADHGASATSTSEKEDLNAKLQRQRQRLRKELAARKGSQGGTDLSKFKTSDSRKAN